MILQTVERHLMALRSQQRHIRMTGVLSGKQCLWEYFQVVNFAV